MNEKANEAGTPAANETKFRVRIGVRTRGTRILSIHPTVVVSTCQRTLWSGWEFRGPHVVFMNDIGGQLTVPLATSDANSLAGLVLVGETIGRIHRSGSIATGLLWACLVERLHGYGVVEAECGGELDVPNLSADLRAMSLRNGGLS